MNGNAGSRRDKFFSRIPFAVSFSPANSNVCTLQLLWMFTIVGAVFSSPQDVKRPVKEHDSLNLTCNLSGSNITWNYEGKIIGSGRVWRLESIMRNASGVYRCTNSTSEENYTVIVEYGAEGRIPANVTRVNLGGTLNIHCEVHAKPQETNVTWFFEGRIKGNSSNLTISNVSCSSQGIYICSPVNNISNAENGTTSVNFTDGNITTIRRSAEPPNSNVLGIALSLVFGIFVVVVAIGCYLRFRHRRQCCCKAYCNGFFTVQDEPPPPSPTKRPSLTSFSKAKHGAVLVDDFARHVKILHMDGDYRFSQEFESLKSVHLKSRSWVHSEKQENQSKNRFNNIVAYDHSRVILSLTENDPESHYINANYIDSFEKANAYIATQGPVANTISDFWRMVWEQNCTVIVMITKIIERGRHKCTMYWPSKQAKTEVHGPLRVTYLDEEAFAHYTVRRFEVKPVEQGSHYCQDMAEDEVKPMIVSQFHFTGWPDHGAPDTGCEFPALSFILKSATASRDGAGPVIVHCSAGVGRSGAYILIHSMVKRMHVTGDINVFDFLSQIRQQRNHLVQEECQYIFVHDALQHYIESGFKLDIAADDLKDHLQILRKNLSSQSRLDLELEYLNAVQIKHYNLKQAKRGCNMAKNRSVDYIPADSARVELFPRPREEGSDYINASYLPGFWKSQAYIATQYPLEETTNDFWRMVWQENCRSVVMLVSKEELQQDYYHSYLPPSYETARFGDYEVTVDSLETLGDIVVRKLRMAAIKDPTEYRNIQHFHFLHWPEDGNPWSGQTILQLIRKVDSWEDEVKLSAKPFETIGPIVVHCNYGIGRTGVYCLLHTMYHQIARENTVSIYQVARLYNFQRPSCISTKEHYEFCYDTLVEYIEAGCSLHLV